ncbi:5-epiaristolochene 1,3-dihydroxylase-like [Solanum tuberosum]|uniref:5-epiaristolochene 1,3-dihydroxylase-like n=1 Tax=Solanum tuberosum TaxID=4113 RepID=UPI00073A2585|nr:PREDICTED: 5-epiaristolochene 1,3-dihydroxylase-like [Solanum tuberosum]
MTVGPPEDMCILKENLENKATRNKGISEFGGEDLVDVLHRLMEDTELEYPITNDHIKAVIIDIFVAGSETSAAITIWVLSEMMKKPNIIAKALKEVTQVFSGKKNYDNEEKLEKLTYLNLVIKETLRLHTQFLFYRLENVGSKQILMDAPYSCMGTCKRSRKLA